MAELYLVRHGQASFRSENYDQLSPLGTQQGLWLGEYLHHRGRRFDSILIGPLARHRQTAEAIATGLQLQAPEFHIIEGLNEFNFQQLFDAYVRQHPAEALRDDAPVVHFYKLLRKGMQQWYSGDLTSGIDETWQQFENRIHNVLAVLQSEFHGQKVLAVSSGGAIAMLLRHILQAPGQTAIELNLQIRNTAIAHCFFNRHAFRMTMFNHLPHLDTPEREHNITYS